jgi:hypothetical protein
VTTTVSGEGPGGLRRELSGLNDGVVVPGSPT